jgi:formylglycine-generating enzyme required for sulfatase activity
MQHVLRAITLSATLMLLASTAAAQGVKPLKKCAPDAVVSGAICMDRYEASVWRVPGPTTINKGLVKKIQLGKATKDALLAGAATQLGTPGDNYAPCAENGQNCAEDIYAVSLSGVTPSSNITWFQALAACENAGKRLPSNAEWQAAVAGTPDPGPDNGTTDCNTTTTTFMLPEDPANTGSRSSCVSARGAFDMVGNLFEWVADWVAQSTTCGTWNAAASPTGDAQCFAGAATTDAPGALRRGGGFNDGTSAGPLWVDGSTEPSSAPVRIGFRCAR